MKRCMLLNALLWVLGVSAFAQTQGIAFETSRLWKKVVEKARGEGKLIFVDGAVRVSNWLRRCSRKKAWVSFLTAILLMCSLM